MRDEHNKQPNKSHADIMFFAFRYSLGRRSYAPNLVQDYIKEHIYDFDANSCLQMANEILSYYQLHKTEPADYSDIQEGWFEFREYLRGQMTGKK